jgi:hypothetical protein
MKKVDAQSRMVSEVHASSEDVGICENLGMSMHPCLIDERGTMVAMEDSCVESERVCMRYILWSLPGCLGIGEYHSMKAMCSLGHDLGASMAMGALVITLGSWKMTRIRPIRVHNGIHYMIICFVI